jgi:hypothetical protein
VRAGSLTHSLPGEYRPAAKKKAAPSSGRGLGTSRRRSVTPRGRYSSRTSFFAEQLGDRADDNSDQSIAGHTNTGNF